MKVLGICGSPRMNGNSDILLTKALEGAKSKQAETEKVYLNTMKFWGCSECIDARKDGVCKINDEMQVLYKKIDKADAIIVASPIFFGSLSSQTKMMIDRFQCYWTGKNIYKTVPLKKKRSGAFICVEASKKKDFIESAKAVIKNFFATIDLSYADELLCVDIEEKGGINKYPNYLKEAYLIGAKLASDSKKE